MNREELLKNAKPILFNTEMVQAILEGRKTVTRRVVKYYNRTPTTDGKDKFNKIDENLNGTNPNRLYAGFYNDNDIFYIDGEKHIDGIYYPLYFKVGDILYVRETWTFISCDECKKSESHTDFNSTGCGISAEKKDYYKDNCGCYVYRTNYGTTEDDSFPPSMFKWRPSIHMPKSAARIFLKVTDVRVERLQDINGQGHHDDILKEGLKNNCRGQRCASYGKCSYQMTNLTYCFSELWDGTIKKQDLDKYGWEANPFCWVIEFERVEDK